MTLYADCGGLVELKQDPFLKEFIMPSLSLTNTLSNKKNKMILYQRNFKSETHFEAYYTCFVANYSLMNTMNIKEKESL